MNATRTRTIPQKLCQDFATESLAAGSGCEKQGKTQAPPRPGPRGLGPAPVGTGSAPGAAPGVLGGGTGGLPVLGFGGALCAGESSLAPGFLSTQGARGSSGRRVSAGWLGAQLPGRPEERSAAQPFAPRGPAPPSQKNGLAREHLPADGPQSSPSRRLAARPQTLPKAGEQKRAGRGEKSRTTSRAPCLY